MQKSKINKKVFLLLLLLISYAGIKAQSCSSPLTVSTNGTWRGQDSFNVVERYHKFSAAHDNYKIKFFVKNYSSGNFSIDVLKNQCSPLTSLSPTITAIGDSVTVIQEGLTIGTDYLIRMRNTIAPTYMVYNLQFNKYKLYSQVNLGCFLNDCGAPTNTCELVCNGSFECLNNTVTDISQINYAGNWTSANAGSPDLFVTGGAFGYYGIPCNAFGTQAAFTGTNYAGIFVHQNGSGFAEYLQTELQLYMNAGQKYLISFYVSRADRSQQILNNVGVYLSPSQISDNGTLILPATGPGSYSLVGTVTNNTLLNDVNNWQRVTICYTAIGGEKFLAIGRANNATPVGTSPPNISPCSNFSPYTINFNAGYLYVDEVSVRALEINAGPNVAACGQPSIQTTLQGNVICSSTSPFNYAWSPVTGLSSSTILNPIATVTSNTIYNLNASVTDSQNQNCVVSSTVAVVVGTPPALGIGSNIQNVCTNLNQSAILSAGSYPSNFYTSYTWQPGNLSGSSVTVTPSIPTVYTVTAGYGACTTTAALAIGTFSNCCTNTVNAWQYSTIPPGTYGDIVINSDLTITGVNAVTSFTGNVLIAPNVKIYNNNINNTLIFGGAHVYACADMWGGIEVTGGNNVTCSKGSLIEDALVAISAVNNSSFVVSPISSILNITGTVFNRNYIAISIEGYQLFGAGTNYPFSISDNVFTCRNLPFTLTSWPTSSVTSLKAACTATATSYAAPYLNASCANNYPQVNLKAPYTNRPSHIAIKLVNVGTTYNSGINTSYNGIQIGDPNNVKSFNLFDSHGSFIYATNSNVYSYNNVFQNTLRYIVGANPRPVFFGGSAIYSDVQSGFNLNGLFNPLLNLNTNTNVSPSMANRFWDCHIGVDGTNTFSLNVKYATFRSSHQIAGYVGFDPGHTGVIVRTNRYGGFTLDGNYFNNIKNGINLPSTSGSYDVGAGTQNGIYAGNISIQNNYIGAAITNTVAVGTNYSDQAISLTAPISVPWQSVGNTGVYINANNINRVFNGITLNGLNVVTNFVVNNTISSMLDENVLYNNQRGINVLNSANTYVQTNTLSATNTTNTRITLVYSGVNTKPKVFCNNTSNAYQGFEFNSAHTGVAIWNGNIMQTHQRGMTLSGGAVIGTQGSTGNPSDNQWLPQGGWLGSNFGTYVDASSDAQFSKLWVKNFGVWAPPNPGFFASGLSYAISTNTPNTTGTYTCGGGSGPPPPTSMMSSQISSSQTMAATTSANAPLEAKYIADNNFYRYLNANPTVKTSNIAYTSFYNSKANSSMDKFTQAEVNFANGQITQAQSLNNAVITANAAETNYKAFYNLYAKSKTANFTAIDSLDLVNLANLCQNTNGAAVYQARALYNYIYKTVLNVADNCTTQLAGSRFGITSTDNGEQDNIKTNWAVEIFPNPASSDITIVSKTEAENLSVTIKDVTGKLVYNNNLQTTNFISKLDLILLNGVYLITINNNANESITKKLVIAK